MQGVLSFSLYDVAVKQICSFRVDIEFFIVDLPFLWQICSFFFSFSLPTRGLWLPTPWLLSLPKKPSKSAAKSDKSATKMCMHPHNCKSALNSGLHMTTFLTLYIYARIWYFSGSIWYVVSQPCNIKTAPHKLLFSSYFLWSSSMKVWNLWVQIEVLNPDAQTSKINISAIIKVLLPKIKPHVFRWLKLKLKHMVKTHFGMGS